MVRYPISNKTGVCEVSLKLAGSMANAAAPSMKPAPKAMEYFSKWYSQFRLMKTSDPPKIVAEAASVAETRVSQGEVTRKVYHEKLNRKGRKAREDFNFEAMSATSGIGLRLALGTTLHH